jgi:N-acetylmuramoyl-L-alanine amidase
MILEKPQYIIIHHTGTFRDQRNTTWQSVTRYHKQKWGIDTFGYNKMIEYPDGKIHSGRNFKIEKGYHCSARGMNWKSIGICLEGNFDNEFPSMKQTKNLIYLIDQYRKAYDIPVWRVLAHKEVPYNTQCCGGNLIKWLKLYRRKELLIDLIRILRKKLWTR